MCTGIVILIYMAMAITIFIANAITTTMITALMVFVVIAIILAIRMLIVIHIHICHLLVSGHFPMHPPGVFGMEPPVEFLPEDVASSQEPEQKALRRDPDFMPDDFCCSRACLLELQLSPDKKRAHDLWQDCYDDDSVVG